MKNSGLTLVEIAIALALSSMGVLVINEVASIQARSIKKVQNSVGFAEISGKIAQALNNPALCKQVLGNQNIKYPLMNARPKTDRINIPSLVVNGSTLASVGSNSGEILVTALYLKKPPVGGVGTYVSINGINYRQYLTVLTLEGTYSNPTNENTRKILGGKFHSQNYPIMVQTRISSNSSQNGILVDCNNPFTTPYFPIDSFVIGDTDPEGDGDPNPTRPPTSDPTPTPTPTATPSSTPTPPVLFQTPASVAFCAEIGGVIGPSMQCNLGPTICSQLKGTWGPKPGPIPNPNDLQCNLPIAPPAPPRCRVVDGGGGTPTCNRPREILFGGGSECGGSGGIYAFILSTTGFYGECGHNGSGAYAANGNYAICCQY